MVIWPVILCVANVVIQHMYNITSYNPANIFARMRLVYTCHVTEYSPAETGEYLTIQLFAY